MTDYEKWFFETHKFMPFETYMGIRAVDELVAIREYFREMNNTERLEKLAVLTEEEWKEYTQKKGKQSMKILEVSGKENGPLLIQTTLESPTSDPNTDESRHTATFALCRCGASIHKPFCDGAHRACQFTATAFSKLEDVTRK